MSYGPTTAISRRFDTSGKSGLSLRNIILYGITVHFRLCVRDWRCAFFPNDPSSSGFAPLPLLARPSHPLHSRWFSPRCNIDFNPRVSSIPAFFSVPFFPLASRIAAAAASVRLFRKSGSFTFSVDSMGKPPGEFRTDCLARLHLGSHLLGILCAPSRKLSCVAREHFPRRTLYTIIGPRKTMRAAWQTRLASPDDPRVLLRRDSLREINRAHSFPGGNFSPLRRVARSGVSPSPLSLLYAAVSRTREEKSRRITPIAAQRA